MNTDWQKSIREAQSGRNAITRAEETEQAEKAAAKNLKAAKDFTWVLSKLGIEAPPTLTAPKWITPDGLILEMAIETRWGDYAPRVLEFHEWEDKKGNPLVSFSICVTNPLPDGISRPYDMYGYEHYQWVSAREFPRDGDWNMIKVNLADAIDLATKNAQYVIDYVQAQIARESLDRETPTLESRLASVLRELIEEEVNYLRNSE